MCCTCNACLRSESDLKLIEQQFAKLDSVTRRKYAHELLSQTDVKDELRKFVETQVRRPHHRPLKGRDDSEAIWRQTVESTRGDYISGFKYRHTLGEVGGTVKPPGALS
jgi:hypothetical protein